MIDSRVVLITLLALFILLDWYTVAVQVGFTRSHLARLIAIREQGSRSARLAVDLLHSLLPLKKSLQLMVSFLHLGIGGLMLAFLFNLKWAVGGWLVTTGVFVLAALVFFTIERVIEVLVSRRPEVWAVQSAFFARSVTLIFSPFVSFFLMFERGEDKEHGGTGAVTEDELKVLVDASQQDGVLEQGEREMIYSIFRLGDTLAREIMVPRVYITALDVSLPLDQVVKIVLESGHSRLPVYEETIDHVVGLLYARDLLSLMQTPKMDKTLRDLLRPPYFVPEAKKVDELLDEMQAQRIHMAIVIDEYGGVAGLVTLEDIVEEIVGEIRDEYDQAEEMPWQKVGEDEYIFMGRVDLSEVNELMETNLPKNEAETIGGLMYSQFGRVPASGETVQVENILFTVEQVSGRRIRKVRARKAILSPDTVEGESNADG